MSFAGTIMENQQAQSQATRHLGSLLQLQRGGASSKGRGSAVSVLNQLFAAAEQRLETDNDKRVVELLKSQVATFINKSLGIYAFDHTAHQQQQEEEEEDDDDENKQPTLSWADVASMPDEPVHSPQPTRYRAGYGAEDDSDDDGFAERAEKLHLDNLAADYNSYDKGDDEPDSDHEEEQRSRGIQSRGIRSGGGNGFQTVQKRRYRRTEYRHQGGVSCQEFRPSYLHALPADTYCIPIFFPSEESYDVRTLNK
jgi:hypothetical protein